MGDVAEPVDRRRKQTVVAVTPAPVAPAPVAPTPVTPAAPVTRTERRANRRALKCDRTNKRNEKERFVGAMVLSEPSRNGRDDWAGCEGLAPASSERALH